ETFGFDEAMSRLVGPTRARHLRHVLVQLEPFLSKIFPGAEAMLEARPRVPDGYPVIAELRDIAAALGVACPSVHRGAGREVLVLLTDPRALVLGGDLLTDAGARSLITFHGAYACARMAGSG